MIINKIDLNRPQKYSRQSHKTEFTGQKSEAPSNIKRAAAIGSAIGSGAALALIAKRQGFSLNPNIIKNTPIKDWAIFKIPRIKSFADRAGFYKRPPLEIEENEILTLASGSVAGGLASGVIVDRKNMKAKGREALTQLAGNVIVPVAFVGGTARLYSKFEKQIKSAIPTIKTEGKKSLRMVNKFTKSIPAVTMTSLALAGGIFTGSKVTNFINEKLFGQKTERKIKTTDFAPHVDDICLAVTLMGSKNSALASSITRTVPLFLSVPGYQVGKAQEEV